MQVSLTVCNICQELSRQTTQYELKRDGGKAKVDLCEEHATFLETLLASHGTVPRKAPAKKAAAAPTTTRRRRSNVVSLDEIERGKATGSL